MSESKGKLNVDNFSCVYAEERRNTQGRRPRPQPASQEKTESLVPGAGVLGRGSSIFQKSFSSTLASSWHLITNFSQEKGQMFDINQRKPLRDISTLK